MCKWESIESIPKEKKSRCVIRLRTVYWVDSRGLHKTVSLRQLKRLSYGLDIIYEDCQNTGAEDVFIAITNVNECADGIYEVVMCNETHDFETGIIDGYDYKLVPFDKEET